jgi:hypothetical protein
MVRQGRVLVRVEVRGCDATSAMEVQMMHPMGREVADGCVRDAVWRVRTPGAPDRYTRLRRGRASLDALLERYSFVDGGGCSYSADPQRHAYQNLVHNARKIGDHAAAAVAAYGRTDVTSRRRPRYLSADLDEVLRYVTPEIGGCHFRRGSIAQLSERSGICWYSSMWFVLLFGPELRAFLARRLHARRAECAHCRFLSDQLDHVLNDQQCSERVRRYLWESMRLGDPYGQAPELDGQNGCSVACMLLAMLDVPVLTVVAPGLTPLDVPLEDADGRARTPRGPKDEAEPCLLIVRTHRSRWRPPQVLDHAGRRFVLASAFIGSEHCGHQTGVSRSCEKDVWAFSDSDAIRLGIWPICFRVPPTAAWHEVVDRAVPYSNASDTNEFCDMSPKQRHPLKVVADHLRAQGLAAAEALDTSSRAHDLVNVDYIYLQHQA